MGTPIHSSTADGPLAGDTRRPSSPSPPSPPSPPPLPMEPPHLGPSHPAEDAPATSSSSLPDVELMPPTGAAVLHASLDADADADANVDVEQAAAAEPPPSHSASPAPNSNSNTPIPAALAARLYTSHFLSTWNTRVFEFAAVLFLAAIFPDTLLPMSVYAVVRGVAAMVLAEAVGACIDRGDRLVVVRASILGQRAAVAVSCGVFWVMLARAASTASEASGVSGGSGGSRAFSTSGASTVRAFITSEAKGNSTTGAITEGGGGGGGTFGPAASSGLFAVAVVAACVEKLCSVMNLVAVERDWVVVMTEGNEAGRRLLNARMRRIDLFCKLAGPLAISLVAAASTRIALYATLGMSAASVVIEYFCIAVVYRRVPELRRRPVAWGDGDVPAGGDPGNNPGPTSLTTLWTGIQAVGRRLLPFASLPFYFKHPAFLPSFSLAVLYLTVLSFSGQMVTFLLASGYTPLYVGVARTASTVFELSATWIAPRLMSYVGVVRGGLWSLSWQALWLTAATVLFWSGPGGLLGQATSLTAGVALSRIGLWGYDLCAQSIVQDEVADAHRGAFSTAEAAFQNLFEVLAYATTIVFSRPDQFRWPVVVSVTAVYTASALYTAFVRRRRGHLFHSPLPPQAQRWLEKALLVAPRQQQEQEEELE